MTDFYGIEQLLTSSGRDAVQRTREFMRGLGERAPRGVRADPGKQIRSHHAAAHVSADQE
jgi:hypothetical protein